MSYVGIIILAAGNSSRMGQSKQLLSWRDETLLSHAVKTALNSRAQRVAVVLGAHEAAHRNAIAALDVDIIVNAHWPSGMGSSLKVGIRHFKDSTDACIVMVCDQPLLKSTHLNKLIDQFDLGRSIVASRYNHSNGVPALFQKAFYDEMLLLGDAEGAKKVIQHNAAIVTAIDFPEGELDVDTTEQYAKLRGN